MAPMPEKKPSVQEFEHRVNALIHLPTGATWTLRPGSTDVRSFKPSNLGVALPDGNFYAEGDSTHRIAAKGLSTSQNEIA